MDDKRAQEILLQALHFVVQDIEYAADQELRLTREELDSLRLLKIMRDSVLSGQLQASTRCGSDLLRQLNEWDRKHRVQSIHRIE